MRKSPGYHSVGRPNASGRSHMIKSGSAWKVLVVVAFVVLVILAVIILSTPAPLASTPISVIVASTCPQPSGYNGTGNGIRMCFNPLNFTSATASGTFVRISVQVNYSAQSAVANGACSDGVCSATFSLPGQTCGDVDIIVTAYDANSVPSYSGVVVRKC